MFSRVIGEFGAREPDVEKGSTKTLLTSEGYGFSPLGRVQWVEGLKRIRITQERITQARVALERMT